MQENTPVTCPHCGRPQYAGEACLGPLGGTFHFRCRDCGGQWSVTADQAGETKLECRNWDSFDPQNVYDAAGKCIGVLQPRATAEQLGYGIQGWSRPEHDTRNDIVACDCGQIMAKGYTVSPCPHREAS